MIVDGIWKIEMMGLYDWEPVSTAFLEKGKYLAGGNDHYTTGSYEVDGKEFRAKTTVIVHGQLRTFLGKKAKKRNVLLNGKLSKDKIQGTGTDSAGKYEIHFRATKLV